jgi:hypothetical protein
VIFLFGQADGDTSPSEKRSRPADDHALLAMLLPLVSTPPHDARADAASIPSD